MPRFDGTGPLGTGPIGLRRGYCGSYNLRNVTFNPYLPPYNAGLKVTFLKLYEPQ